MPRSISPTMAIRTHNSPPSTVPHAACSRGACTTGPRGEHGNTLPACWRTLKAQACGRVASKLGLAPGQTALAMPQLRSGAPVGPPPCVVWLHERPAVARSLDAHGFGQLGDGNTFKRQDGVVNAPCPGVRDCELGCSEELFGNALTVERPRAGPVIDWDISIVSATIRGN